MQAGGLPEISRWCKPPAKNPCATSPGRGVGITSGDFRRPCRGSDVCVVVVQWLAPPANFRQASGLSPVWLPRLPPSEARPPSGSPQARRQSFRQTIAQRFNAGIFATKIAKSRRDERSASGREVGFWSLAGLHPRSAGGGNHGIPTNMQAGGLPEISRWCKPPDKNQMQQAPAGAVE